MLNEAAIAVIFKLINFALLIAGTCFVFKKYFALKILNAIKEKNDHISKLQEEIATFIRKQQLTEKEIIQDKECAAILQKKVERWQNTLENQKQLAEEKNSLIQLSIEKKHQKQKKYVEHKWLYNQIFPLALKNAEQQLRAEYASEKKQSQFINAIIQTIKHG